MDGLAGQFSVGRDLLGTFQIDHIADAPPPGPQVAIGGALVGQLVMPNGLSKHLRVSAGSITESGSVRVAGITAEAGLLDIDATSPVMGQVRIDGGVVGEVRLSGGLSDGASFEVTGNVGLSPGGGTSHARVQIDELAGTLAVGESIYYDSGVEVTVSLSGAASVGANLQGFFYTQNLSGSIDVAGTMGDVPENTFGGRIRINGTFVPQNPNEGLIWVHQKYGSDPNLPIGPSSYIAVDYDASGDVWAAGARVVIGNPNNPNDVYYGNTPEKHLWAISYDCKADMNNDWAVDFGDINPFILALSDPAGYALAFPGLDGSRVYHGDVNCDQVFNFGDINTFVLLMEYQCCMASDCEPCWGDDDSEPLGPEELAAQLAANIWPELYDDLVNIIAAEVSTEENDATREYWEAVYAALTE